MDRNEAIEIPFGAKDSELKGWEYTIPEGMEAVIKDGKIIFREKESEDERIRKEIHIYLDWLDGRNKDYQPKGEYSIKDMIVWLEKQGEHQEYPKDVIDNAISFLANRNDGMPKEVAKDIVNAIITVLNPSCWPKQGEQKSDAKVEPKFKVGNWYLCVKDFLGKGVRFDKGNVYHCGKDGCLQEFDSGAHIDIVEELYEYFRLWTIEDAKDGDILYSPGGKGVEAISIVRGWKKIDGIRTLCAELVFRVKDNEFIKGGIGAIWWEGVIDPFFPATKEQRETLFEAIHEAGYEWDAEKKELVKDEQNPAWSEEDKKRFESTLHRMEIVGNGCAFGQLKDDIDWLKSLKERYTWKPSDEQMEYLAKAITTLGNEGDNKTSAILCELRTDLKKLKK